MHVMCNDRAVHVHLCISMNYGMYRDMHDVLQSSAYMYYMIIYSPYRGISFMVSLLIFGEVLFHVF